MKKLVIILFAAVSLTGINTQAYADELEDLLEKRKGLIEKANELYLENNAFFGGKSKQDLRRIVQTLGKVVRLDNNIIDEVERKKENKEFQNFRLESTVRDAARRVQELESANKNLRRKLAEARGEESPAEEVDHDQVDTEEGSNYKTKNYLALTAALIFFVTTNAAIYVMFRNKGT